MTIPLHRPGDALEIANREIEFSLFPARRGRKGWHLADTIFAVSPWAVMQGAIDSRLPKTRRAEPTAFLEQAQDFYVAARDKLSANPLLYYYAFLNVGKALLRVRQITESLDHAHHGLGEVPVRRGGGLTLSTAMLKVRDGSDKAYVFPTVLAALKYPRPANETSFAVRELLPQIVVGHRQWRDAEDQDERFVRTEVELRHDSTKQRVWACLYVRYGDLSRYGITSSQLLAETGLEPAFREVHSLRTEHYCFEQLQPTRYRREPVDVLRRLAVVPRYVRQ